MNKQDHRWIFLSYELNEQLSSYGNGDRVVIEDVNRIQNGNSNNTSKLIINSHFGTHIDFPFHFSESGGNGSSYSCDDYLFEKVQIIDISKENIDGFIITKENLKIEKLDSQTDLLIVKTGFGSIRDSETYWKYNWGFSPYTAAYLKNHFPKLRAIGFDLMSLSSFQRRDVGRNAHREFLISNNILLIEDMDLSKINRLTNINEILVSPLRFNKADGSPVTIFANIELHD